MKFESITHYFFNEQQWNSGTLAITCLMINGILKYFLSTFFQILSKFFFQHFFPNFFFPNVFQTFSNFFFFIIFFFKIFFFQNFFPTYFFQDFFFTLKFFFSFQGLSSNEFFRCWLQIYNQKYKTQNARFSMATNISKNQITSKHLDSKSRI